MSFIFFLAECAVLMIICCYFKYHKMVISLPRIITLTCLMLISDAAFSQRYLSDLDSSLFIRDTLRPFLKRFENLQFTGYIQPQFQLADTAGARSYNGGDFSTHSRSRFMLRRARVKLDYFLITPDSYPKALF